MKQQHSKPKSKHHKVHHNNKSRDTFCRDSTIPGHRPKICTSQWGFFEDCTYKKIPHGVGRYERDWMENVDTLPKPYKEIAKARTCLPKLPTAKCPSSSRKQNQIYTRYTPEQHRQRETVDRIEQMIKMKFSSRSTKMDTRFGYRGKAKSTGGDKILSLRLSSEPPRVSINDPKEKAEDTSKKEDETAKDTNELENLMDMKLKNPYKSFAPKAARMGRNERATLAKRQKQKRMSKDGLPVPDDDDVLDELGGDGDDSFPGHNTTAETRLNEVVREFCDSIADLGGDEGNIDPTTINCLFTSGYDTTPSMSAPVSLVKQAELPSTLRDVPTLPAADSNSGLKKKESFSSKAAFQKQVKADRNGYRYGAWYLEPRSWTRMKRDTQLQDPKTIKWEATMTDLDMKKRQVTEELSSFRITRAFAEFISNRNSRLPEFILEAERFCLEREDKEKQKIEAEARAKQEYLNVKNKWNTA